MFDIKIFMCCLLSLSGIVSCQRTSENYLGPEVKSATANFAILSPFKSSADSVNFLKDTLRLTAKFNEPVSYSITITGSKSGAIKKITGVSDEINTVWDGSAELVFFRKEFCTTKLTILGVKGIMQTEPILIFGIYKPKATIIANMEPADKAGIYGGCGFFETGALINCGLTDEVTPLEGTSAMLLEGADVKGGKFIGVSFTKPDGRNGFMTGPGKPYNYKTNTTIADSLWFTIFIYGTGQKETQMFIKFMQDDDGLSGHDPKKENGFELQITDLSHTGWKAFSYNYASINLGGNTDFGGSGDGIHRPDKIAQIEYSIWSVKPNLPVKIIFDYPVFTVGKPFVQ